MKNEKKSHILIVITLSFLGTLLLSAENCLGDVPGSTGDNNEHFTISGDLKGLAVYRDLDCNNEDLDDDTDFLTRLRVQLKSQIYAFKFVGRINASKWYETDIWDDDDFFVDRFYLSWENIFNIPLSISGGRLPTMGENSPSHYRLGLDKPNGTLSSFTDIALDGALLEYKYQALIPGRIQFYYASQIDAGYEGNKNNTGLEDTNIYGVKWDIIRNDTRSATLQSFLVADVRNIPDDLIIPNPLELYSTGSNNLISNPSDLNGIIIIGNNNGILDRVNLGDIYQTALTYTDVLNTLNIFISLGWSHTNPDGMDEFGNSLLHSFFEEPKSEDSYAVYAGMRYDLDNLYSQVGLEYNWGSKFWISFPQDLESSKLGTRGSVYEAYWIFHPPLPLKFLKFLQVISRIGYQYFDYEYTGSGFWLGEPVDIDSLKSDPLSTQFYTPIDTEYRIYAALEIYF